MEPATAFFVVITSDLDMLADLRAKLERVKRGEEPTPSASVDAAITFPFPLRAARGVAIAPDGEYALFVLAGSLIMIDRLVMVATKCNQGEGEPRCQRTSTP